MGVGSVRIYILRFWWQILISKSVQIHGIVEAVSVSKKLSNKLFHTYLVVTIQKINDPPSLPTQLMLQHQTLHNNINLSYTGCFFRTLAASGQTNKMGQVKQFLYSLPFIQRLQLPSFYQKSQAEEKN